MKPHREAVPVAPFRKRFEELGLTRTEVARRIGWVNNRDEADTTRVSRALGLMDLSTTGHPVSYVYPRTAERLCGALDLDPVDVGL